MSERIFCPKCGRDLGPAQPLPSAETKCPFCRVWVKASETEDPEYVQIMHDNQGVISGAETGNAKNRY